MAELRERVGLAALLAVVSACGGSPTASPVSGAAVAVTTVNGITGAAVPAAGPASAVPGTAADFSAAGFFTRATLVPRDGRVYLWPLTVDEAYARAIVYESWSFSGTQRLFRWSVPTVTITPGVSADALAEIASTGTITLVPSATPDIEVTVNPDDPDIAGGFVGFTRCTTNGYAIAHCRVVVRDAAAARSSTLTHELGHTLGLGHSARASDLMYPNTRRPDRFTSDERVLLTMMYARRRPGNGPPDDDRTLAATSTVWTLAIRD